MFSPQSLDSRYVPKQYENYLYWLHVLEVRNNCGTNAKNNINVDFPVVTFCADKTPFPPWKEGLTRASLDRVWCFVPLKFVFILVFLKVNCYFHWSWSSLEPFAARLFLNERSTLFHAIGSNNRPYYTILCWSSAIFVSIFWPQALLVILFVIPLVIKLSRVCDRLSTRSVHAFWKHLPNW